MADQIVVSFDFPGVAEGERAVKMLSSLQATLKAGTGAGKSLEEVRKIMVGMKGQASIFEDLRNSINGLNASAANLKAGFTTSITGLGNIVKSEFATLAAQIKTLAPQLGTSGVSAGKAMGAGVSAGLTTELTKAQVKAAAQAKGIAAQIGGMEFVGEYSPYNARTSTAAFLKKSESDTKATNAAIYRSNLQNAKSLSAAEIAFNKSVTADTSASYRSMYAYKTAEAKKAAASETAFTKAVTADTAATYNRIYTYKVAEAKKAATAETAFTNAITADTATTYNRMYAYKTAEAKKTAAAETAFTKSIAADTMTTYNRMYAYKVAEAKKAAAAEIALAAGVASAQVRAATMMPSGVYSNVRTGRVVGEASAARATAGAMGAAGKPAEVDNLSRAFKDLTVSGNNAHSMARGLASGFNLLWLTWGNLAPLFVGAAISNGFVQTAKTGMEVAHTFGIIANLGGNTVAQVSALGVELNRIGKSGPFGPLEVVAAMRSLSLAGLEANDILKVTQSVLNFSVAGDTDLKTAADTLVYVSTAFGLGAQGFGRVADVISKAAAESMSSVESFAGAMRQASVIGSQYGVSLEDTAVGIAALSQIGIQGTAAGTALRNMYADLSGRSMHVAKILKAQGIEMRDAATGGFRPMLDVVADLNTKLQQLEPLAQKNLLQAILSERGAKGIIELLQLINREADDLGSGLPNALAELQRTVTESYGFAAISAAKLSQTADSQFKAVRATMQTSMNEAYAAMEPVLLLIADSLKRTFGSPEFVSSLTNMVTLVARLGQTLINFGAMLVDHLNIVLSAVAAYIAWNAAVRIRAALVAMSTAATLAATAATVVDTAATVANNVAKAGAVGMLGRFGALIPGIGTAVAIASAAWMSYDYWVSASKDSAKEADDLYNTNVIKSLRDQTDKIAALNELRRTGLSLTEAQAVLDAKGQMAKSTAPAQAGYAKAQAAEQKAWEDFQKASDISQAGGGGSDRYLANLKNTAVESSKVASKAYNDVTNAMVVMRGEQTRHVEVTKEQTELDKAADKARKEARFKSGPGTFDLATVGGDRDANRLAREADRVEKASLEYRQRMIEEAAQLEVRKLEDVAKVRENSRAQGFIGDLEYYQFRIQNASDIAAIEVNAIRDSIELRKGAKFVGPSSEKDRIDNLKALVILEGKLAETTTNNTTAAIILGSTWTETGRKITESMRAATVATDNYLENLRVANSLQTSGMGLGNDARERQNAESKILQTYIAQVKVQRDLATSLMGQTNADGTSKYTDDKKAEVDFGISEARRLYEGERAISAAGYAQKRLDESNWQLGLSEGINNYISDAGNMYKQSESLAANAFKGMSDSLVDFVMTGKLSFTSLAQSILADLTRMIIQQEMFNALKAVGGGSGIASWIGAGVSGMMGGGSGPELLSTPNTFAKGGAFNNAPGLSAYSGSIVSKPTIFPFARGGGLMGEAGPEAILPLKRGAGGKLGVQATGGGGMGDVYVTVDATGSKVEGDDNRSNQLGAMIGNAVRAILITEKRPGGMLA